MGAVSRPSRRWSVGPRSFGALVLVILFVLSGCAGDQGAALPDDGPAPPFSRAAALSFVQKTLTAGQTAVAERAFTLTVADAEVTSFLSIRRELTREMQTVGMEGLSQLEGLEELQIEAINPDAWGALLGRGDDGGRRGMPLLRVGLREPRVHFRANGHAIGRGELAFLRWRLPVRVVVAPHAASGEMTLDFVEGQVGRFALPEIVFDLLGKGIARALLAGQAYAEITQISVQAGTFTISGRYNR